MEATNLIGTILKEAREKSNISIEQISQKTKINVNILKALEANDIEKLPNLTYVRGFVKNYAVAVGIDINEAKACLEATYNNETPGSKDQGDSPTPVAPKPVIQASEVEARPDEDHTANEHKDFIINFVQNLFKKKIILSVASLIILVVIAKSVVTWVGSINAEKLEVALESTVPTEPVLKNQSSNILKMDASKKFANQIATDAAVKETEKVIEEEPKIPGEKKPTNFVKVETKKVEQVVVVQDEKKVEKKLAPGKFPFKKFSPAPLKMYSTISDSAEASDESLLPNNIKTSIVEGLENVYIVAHDDDTWISYQIDSNPIKRYVLKKGRRVLIKGEKILLFIGNYNVSRIFYNNKLIQAKTRSGVKSLIFPHTAAKDHMLPLFPSYKGIPYKAAEYIEKMESETI